MQLQIKKLQSRRACEREQNYARFAGHGVPSRFSERIGSTVYRVSVFFPTEETETLEEKITRLVKSDLKFQSNRGIIDTLQTGRLPDGGSL